MDKSSWFTDYLAKPVAGPDHEAFRKDVWIGGTDAVCSYYLSMLKRRDYFILPLEDLRNDIIDYVKEHASPTVTIFVHTKLEFANYAMPFLKQQFNRTFGIDDKFTKEERGMILLLEHPDWTDEKICTILKTTEKQMNRWAWYKRARAVQSWHRGSPQV